MCLIDMKLAKVGCSCSRPLEVSFGLRKSIAQKNQFLSKKHCQNLAFPGITPFTQQKCTTVLTREQSSGFIDAFQFCNSWLSVNSCKFRLKLPANYFFLEINLRGEFCYPSITNKKFTHKTTQNEQVAFLMHSSVCAVMRKTVMIQHCCVLT